jgi:ribosome maturation protein Sdo1
MYTYTAIIKIDRHTLEEIDVEADTLKEAKKKVQEVIDDMYGGTPKIKKIIKRGPGLFL